MHNRAPRKKNPDLALIFVPDAAEGATHWTVRSVTYIARLHRSTDNEESDAFALSARLIYSARGAIDIELGLVF